MARHEEKEKEEKGPSLTADLRNGDKEQVLRMLQAEGADLEQYVAIGKDKLLANQVVGILNYQLFSSPKEQIEHMLELNEKIWKDQEMAEAAKRIPDLPHCPAPISTEEGERFYCRFLYYEFRNTDYKVNYLENFWRYWRALEEVYGYGRLFYDRHDNNCRRVTAAEKKKLVISSCPFVDPYHGFYWFVVELGYHFASETFEEIKKRFDEHKLWGLGPEILALFLMHPRWVENFYPRKPDFRLPFGYGPMVPINLTVVSNSRSWPATIKRSRSSGIHFGCGAGLRPGNFLVPYVVNRVPSMGWDSFFAKVI